MTCMPPAAEELVGELSLQLGQVSRKKTSGYLRKLMMKQGDEIVEQMA